MAFLQFKGLQLRCSPAAILEHLVRALSKICATKNSVQGLEGGLSPVIEAAYVFGLVGSCSRFDKARDGCRI